MQWLMLPITLVRLLIALGRVPQDGTAGENEVPHR